MKYLIMTELLVPNKYSRIAIVTSLFILKAAYTCFLNNEKIMGILLSLSYIFTNLHWYNLKNTGLIRNIDISIVVITFIYGTLRSLTYDCALEFNKKNIIVILMFCFNEKLNSKYLYIAEFKNKSEFEKSLIYIRCVLVHTYFLHIYEMENVCYIVNNCKVLS